ncbi:hypothetical protein PsYK624_151030 [Phanerochaete sordida]|uniref:Uncharacterized protein n=1 Tax=Phanerochaete sordida TaxID=48140 RepID=A0A9P3GQ83_9APHY|nr:hypothetical protein PsYK624_151030 [Phanerochaete sordida]
MPASTTPKVSHAPQVVKTALRSVGLALRTQAPVSQCCHLPSLSSVTILRELPHNPARCCACNRRASAERS